MSTLTSYLSTVAEAIRGESTWLEQARASHDAVNALQQAYQQMTEIRREAIRALYTEGWSVGDISNELGISRARVHQILS
jgi:DNA-directed RNA polymerase specialized sigma24 family protein